MGRDFSSFLTFCCTKFYFLSYHKSLQKSFDLGTAVRTWLQRGLFLDSALGSRQQERGKTKQTRAELNAARRPRQFKQARLR